MDDDGPPPWVVTRSVPYQERDPVPKRKPRFQALVELRSQDESDYIGNALATEFIPELTRCTTGEMSKRPVPHAFAKLTPQMVACRELMDRRLPEFLTWIFRRIVIKPQAFDVRGRIGFPVFKVTPRKLQTLTPYWDDAVKGDTSFLRGQFATCNVRCQPEANTKEREFQFVDKNLSPYSKKVGKQDRAFLDGWLSMRTRLVFGYNVLNNANQLVDTLIHDVELESAINHFGSLVGHVIGEKYFFAADVKHFERQVGVLVPLWAKHIGGLYGQWLLDMLDAPFRVPTDDWSQTIDIRPKPGSTVQLGSGVSPVTGLAKALFWIVLAELEHRQSGVTFAAALTALSKNEGYVKVMNYGDDNLYSSDSKDRLDRAVNWVGQFVTLEEEIPAAFLGHSVDEDRVMRMRARSYYANFWWAERPPHSIFRKYPDYGFVMRRALYLRDGQPAVKDMVRLEDKLLRQFNVPYSDIVKRAAREAASLALLPEAYLVGREHVLTLEEKSRLPDYQVLPAERVKHYLKHLLRDSPYGSHVQ